MEHLDRPANEDRVDTPIRRFRGIGKATVQREYVAPPCFLKNLEGLGFRFGVEVAKQDGWLIHCEVFHDSARLLHANRVVGGPVMKVRGQNAKRFGSFCAQIDGQHGA